ncbi:MAG TPA: alkaline phosphatase D family protein [Jiangellaceae bacterium]
MTWHNDPFDVSDRGRHVFVPAIMGAGLLFSLATLVRDLVRSRQGRAPGFDRRLDVAGRASARHVLTGEAPATAMRAAVRPRVYYLLTAITTLGIAVYVVIGATANYFRTNGYVAGVAWLWAVAMILGMLLAFVGGQAWRIFRAWPVPPPSTSVLLVQTPLGRSSTAAVEAEVPRLLLGWATTAATVTTGILVLMVTAQPPWFVEWADTAILDVVTGWGWASALPLEAVGKPELAVVLAALVGVSTLRCRAFALTYIGALAGSWLVYLVLKNSIDRPRPPTGGWVGLDSFPSGHLVQATVLAGLLPLALTVLTKRRWPALVAAGPLVLAVTATAVYRIHLETHWPTDVVAGILIGGTFVLAARWALLHPGWHTRCHGCPWSAASSDEQPEHRHGLFGLHRTAATVVRWATRGWTLAVLATFTVLALVVGLPRNPEGDGMIASVEQPVQLGLLAVAAIGWLVAWRREGVGAVMLALAGSGLAVLSALSYPPTVSVLIAGAFLAPAVSYWLLWQHTRRLRAIVALAATTAALLTGGWLGAGVAYDHYFGPAHPESSTAELPVDRVAWLWSGAVTESSFRATARIDDDARHATLAVEQNGVARARTVGPTPVPDSGIVSWTVDRLEADTHYDFTVVVDGHGDRSRGRGSVRTFPTGPASFTVAVGSCARTGSNGAVFDAIRQTGPLLYIAAGDLHYGNVGVNDVTAFRARYDDVLTSPAQSALYRSTPVAYVWDDHDYGPNDGDAGSPSREAARLAYRENVPHYRLSAGTGDEAIHQAFTVGRVRFILTDIRSERTAESMLGAKQLRWLERELATASRSHAVVVWVNPVPWIAPAGAGRDDWGGYAQERQHIAETIDRARVENLVMLSGDAHMVAIDDGTNSGYGYAGRGFPVLHAAALDRPGGVKGGPYSHGTFPGAGQFGTLTIEDDGAGPVTVEITGRDYTGSVLTTYTFSVPSS